MSFNTYRVSSNANTVNGTFGSAIVGDHWLGVRMHIFTALLLVTLSLYFSSENRLKSFKEMPRKTKAIRGSLTFKCGFARVAAYYSFANKR